MLLLAACGSGDSAAAPRRVVVFAASSLTAAFEALATGFEQRHPGVDVELHFAGTPQLVLQLREGAPADVFAAADTVHMQKVVAAGRTAAAPATFARNGLAIVVAAGNPKGVASLADLARGDLRVALCGPEVPAGRYARQALAQAGVTVRSLSDEPNVKALLGKVRLGELDAGIVYRTDTRDPGVTGIDLAAAHDVVAEYPIAALTNGPAADLAGAFVGYVCSADGARVLAGFGFRGP
ncbi:MAG: molybdate ABC transporter substrate-binding protein [Planctomycetes bacterium]|nr:molybdate ABC transporter substrate-binding protein [Planctomycetota bacterium]